MTRFADYLEDREEELLDEQVSAASLYSEDKEPDRYAEAIEYANDLGVSPLFTYDNIDEIRKRSGKTEIDSTAHPKTAKFASDPDNHALAKDDFDTLFKMEEVDSLLETSAKGLAHSTLQVGKSLLNFERFIWEETSLKHSPIAVVRRAAGNLIEGALGAPLDAVENLERSQEAIGFQPTVSGEDILDDPTLGNVLTMMVEQGPAAAAYLLTSYVSMPATFVTIWDSVAQDRAKNNKLEKAGAEEYAASLPFVVAAATLERIGIGQLFGKAATKIGEKTGLKKEIKKDIPPPKEGTPLPKPKGGFGIAVEGARRGVTESALEGVQGVLEELGATAFTATDVTGRGLAGAAIEEALGSIPVSTAVGTASAYMEAAEQKAVNLVRNTVSSTMEQAGLDEMVELAQSQSKLAKRSKEAFAKFIGEDSVVYADESVVQELLDAGVELPADVVDQLDGSGGSVKIKMKDFLTNPEITKIRDDVRLREDGLSKREMKEGKADEIETLVRKAQENIQKDAEAEEVFAEISEQLVATGRLSAVDARRNAALLSAYINNAADIHGMGAKQFYEERVRARIVGPDRGIPTEMDIELAQRRVEAIESIIEAEGETPALAQRLAAAREALSKAQSPWQDILEADVEAKTEQLLDEQDFGDLAIEEEREVVETGETVKISKPVQQEWDRLTKRKEVVTKLRECLNA